MPTVSPTPTRLSAWASTLTNSRNGAFAPSVGDGLPTPMMADPKGSDIMTFTQFRAQMLGYALGMGKALCESMSLEDTKIEPEQVRKNVQTILVILTETEDFLKDFTQNKSSNSD